MAVSMSFVLVLLGSLVCAGARTFTVANNCPFTIWCVTFYYQTRLCNNLIYHSYRPAVSRFVLIPWKSPEE